MTKEIKKPKNVYLTVSAIKEAEKKAKQMSKKLGVPVSFSAFIELIIYDYSAE